MAFLWKHPQSRYWIARFTDSAGTRRNRTTRVLAREKTRKQAQKIADAYEEVTLKRRTARQVRDTIAALHKEITGEECQFVSFRQFAQSWLERKTPEVASSTLAFYQKATNKVIEFLGEKADAEISQIVSEDIVAFRNHEAKTLAPKTVNHGLKCLRMLFRAARRDRVITDDPCEFVSTTKKAATVRRRPFTVPELRAVLSVADEEWKSLVHFGLYTGQRLGDLAMLTWENVDLMRGEIRLVTRKTGKTLILPIAGPLRQLLETAPAGEIPDAPIHPRAHAIVSSQERTGQLSNQFGDLLAQAGLREKKAHRKTHGNGRGRGSGSENLSFHCLRHTAVSLMKDAGIPASVVMALVGHDSEQMSQVYTHTGMEALERAAASLPDITPTTSPKAVSAGRSNVGNLKTKAK